jgi:hypothetical protein
MRMLVLLLLLLGLCVSTGQNHEQEFAAFLDNLWNEANAAPEGSPKRIKCFQTILQLQPKHVETRIMLAMDLIYIGRADEGGRLIEESFNASIVSPARVLGDTPHSFALANFVGRFRHERSEHATAKRFFELAYSISMKVIPEGNVCSALQLGSLLDGFPPSILHADKALADMNQSAEAFLSRKSQRLNDNFIGNLIPGAMMDPYVHCLLSLFSLSFYYRADTAVVANNHFRMAAAAWPELLYTAPHVTAYDEALQAEQQEQQLHPCVTRKIKLGVIGAMLTEGHSVTEDFSGVLSRLDRTLFQVTYIYIYEKGPQERPASFTQTHFTDRTLVFSKEDTDVKNSAWVRRYGEQISEMELDMILYLDLTMSTHARRLGMERLCFVGRSRNSRGTEALYRRTQIDPTRQDSSVLRAARSAGGSVAYGRHGLWAFDA